jgi:hypothetical protein
MVSNRSSFKAKISALVKFIIYLHLAKAKASRLTRSEAQFIVPDWEDKVDYGIGLLCLPARLHRLAGRYDNPDFIPQSGIYEFGYLSLC